MSNFWDERFATEEYIYGKEPNEFFKNKLIKLPIGKILLPAEGEGRNAIYAAKMGWKVVAFDTSIEGKRKADLLAKENNVKIEYIISDFENADFKLNEFDCIGLFFAHQHRNIRQIHHQKLLRFLKPGGSIILEAFSKQQFGKSTGGPQDIDLLFSRFELQEDFITLDKLNIVELDKELNEGNYHKGIASVVNMIGIK